MEEVGEAGGYWPGAPDLAVEVVSPNAGYAEVEGKVAEWLRAGSRMVIVADPSSRTVRVHRTATDVTTLAEDGEIAGADVVPGWRLPVRDLFG